MAAEAAAAAGDRFAHFDAVNQLGLYFEENDNLPLAAAQYRRCLGVAEDAEWLEGRLAVHLALGLGARSSCAAGVDRVRCWRGALASQPGRVLFHQRRMLGCCVVQSYVQSSAVLLSPETHCLSTAYLGAPAGLPRCSVAAARAARGQPAPPRGAPGARAAGGPAGRGGCRAAAPRAGALALLLGLFTGNALPVWGGRRVLAPRAGALTSLLTHGLHANALLAHQADRCDEVDVTQQQHLVQARSLCCSHMVYMQVHCSRSRRTGPTRWRSRSSTSCRRGLFVALLVDMQCAADARWMLSDAHPLFSPPGCTGRRSNTGNGDTG
jgi:hypothetical protein